MTRGASMAPLLTTAQVAAWLAVSPRAVRLWAESGDLPGLKIGRQWRFRSEAIEHWLARKEPQPGKYLPYYLANTGKHGNNGIHG
jgi:excisionase family DNA binding protein